MMASGKQHVPPPGIAATHLIIAFADQIERIKTIEVIGWRRTKASYTRLLQGGIAGEGARLGVYCGLGLGCLCECGGRAESGVGKVYSDHHSIRARCQRAAGRVGGERRGEERADRWVIGEGLGRTVGELGKVVRWGVEWNAPV